LRFLPFSVSHGDKLYDRPSDRIISDSDSVEVVLPVAISSSVVESSFTNSSVHVGMARTKHSARAPRENKQSGISRAVKEYECFVCGAKTPYLNNHQRHLARVRKKYEDGTLLIAINSLTSIARNGRCRLPWVAIMRVKAAMLNTTLRQWRKCEK